MAFQFPPIAFLTILSLPLWLGLIFIVSRKQTAPGATPLLFILTGALIWTGCNTLHLLYVSVDFKVFWANCQYFGIVLLPAAWIVFALEYTGYEKYITKEAVLLLSIEPLVVLGAVWTNPIHGWFRSDIALQSINNYVYLVESFGIAFWVHAFYSYALLAGGTALILYVIYQTQAVYRHQAMALTIAVAIPWGANILELIADLPFANTFAPVALIGTGLVFTYAVLEYELLDSPPIPRTLTRNTLIETMDEAAIVVDSNNRIIDYNNTGQQMLAEYRTDAIGSAIDDILPEFGEWLSGAAPRLSFHQTTLTIENTTRYYDVQIFQLTRETNVVTGHILILRDVTERERHRQRLEVMNRILRHDLRNQMNILLAHVEELDENPDALEEKPSCYSKKGRTLFHSVIERENSNELLSIAKALPKKLMSAHC